MREECIIFVSMPTQCIPPLYTHTYQGASKTGVACTYSLWSFIPDDDHSRWALWIYETLRDIHLRIQAIKRPELCVRGMAFGFRTDWARRFRISHRHPARRGRLTGIGTEILWKSGIHNQSKSSSVNQQRHH